MRSYGTILIDKMANQPSEVNNDITSYKIDPIIYRETGKLVKLGGEEVVPTIDQIAAGKLLKSEITTIEQYEAIGNDRDVSLKYGVSIQTANGWKNHLRALKEIRPNNVIQSRERANKMKRELDTLEKFEAAGTIRQIMDKYGIGETSVRDHHKRLRKDAEKMEQQSEYKVELEDKPKIPCQSVEDAREDVGIKIEGDCAKEGNQSPESVISETIDDLQGLTEMGEVDPSQDYPQPSEDRLEHFIRAEINDLQGLTEPETPWTMPSYEEIRSDEKFNKFFDRIAEEIKKPVTDEEIYLGIKQDLNELKDRAMKRIQDRLMSMF